MKTLRNDIHKNTETREQRRLRWHREKSRWDIIRAYMPREDAAVFRKAVAEEGLTLNQAMLEALEWWMENRMNRPATAGIPRMAVMACIG